MSNTGLTQKQEKFCLAYLKEGNASEAYRQAYDCSNMKPATVNRKAKALLDNGKIRARIEHLQEEAKKEAVLDRSWVISRLMKVVEIGLNETETPAQVKKKKAGEAANAVEATAYNLSAATKALETLGKLKELRLFVATKEHTGPGGGPIQTMALDPDKLRDMPPDELDALERALGRLTGSTGSGEGGEGQA